jgi:hypothetical protein
MSALQVYLIHANRYRAIFGRPALSLDSAWDRQTLAQSIDGELSPENLTCDGELPRESVESRYRHLTAAARELKKLDPALVFYELDTA